MSWPTPSSRCRGSNGCSVSARQKTPSLKNEPDDRSRARLPPLSCRATNPSSGLAQRRDLGHEDPLLRPEPDDDPALPSLDDLPLAEPGVPDPLPGAVRHRHGDDPLEFPPASPWQRHPPPPAASRRAGYRACLEPLRYLREEARWNLIFALAPVGAQLCVGEDERPLSARYADVGEPPLLLEVLLVEGAGVRERPLLHPHDEDVLELQALRVVERHQRHPPTLAREHVLLRVECLLLQEASEGGLRFDAFVLPCGVYELLQILQARFGLDGVI